MMKYFSEFICESKYDSFSERVATAVVRMIKGQPTGTISRKAGPSSKNDLLFSLSVSVVRSETFEPTGQTMFSRLPWESINFKNKGFVLDANSLSATESEQIIKINILINPKTEPTCYMNLYFKLLDVVRHEIDHLLKPISDSQDRAKAESSYLYFLLPDEISSMVSGMRLSSEKRGVPIDLEFSDYLNPILQSGFMSKLEFDKVMNAWIKFAVKHFPDATISKKYRIS